MRRRNKIRIVLETVKSIAKGFEYYLGERMLRREIEKNEGGRMKLEKLVGIINREFGVPFLPKGMVKAELEKDGTMHLDIGRRDIHVNDKGNVLGAGTRLDEPNTRIFIPERVKNDKK